MDEKIVYKKMTRKADKGLEGKVVAKHGKQKEQRLKTYVVLQYLLKYSDENNPKSAYDIIGYLEDCGISAERRSIYKDIEDINRIMLMIQEDIDLKEVDLMFEEAAESGDEEEINELKTVLYDKNKKGFYVRQRKFEVDDIRLLSLVGAKVVLVHGGGPEISGMLKRVGQESVFKDGLRVTDEETVEIVQMVLAGKTNKDLVNLLENTGGKAIGLCGIDGHMIHAEKMNEDLGFVGEITDINTQPILDLLEKGYIPVVSTVGCDSEGNVYNINADTAAAEIAGKLKAESFISMTDISGLMRDKDDPDSLIRKINVSEASLLIKNGVIQGGMIPKVECCIEAIRRGVQKVFIIDGRIPHAILIETLTDEGIGTMFVG